MFSLIWDLSDFLFKLFHLIAFVVKLFTNTHIFDFSKYTPIGQELDT